MRRRKCSVGKFMYTSHWMARKAMERVETEQAVRGLMVYRCHECGLWHFGHGEEPEEKRDKTWKNWHWRSFVNADSF